MTVVELINVSLLKLGISKGITAVNNSTREALVASLTYDHTLRMTLRRFPWAFATKYRSCREDARHVLYLAAGKLWNTDPALLTTVAAWDEKFRYEIGDVVRNVDLNYVCILGHTNQEPPNTTYWSTDPEDGPETCGNGDWLFAYRWPDDCLYVRREVPAAMEGQGRKFYPTPPAYRIGRDENGLLIYSNTQELEIEYTMLDCTDLWSDDLFLDAFTWRLAATMAPALERAQKTVAECLQLFEYSLSVAETNNLNESQQEPDGDPEWIRNR